MKVCPKCDIEKELTEFSLNRSKKDGHSSICKCCHRLIRKKHYDKNKTTEKARTVANKLRIKGLVEEYKSRLSCIVCGENHPAVLQFHHLNPDEKDFDISQATHNGVSFEKIKSEIDKCVVLCANCHFKEHYSLKNFGKSFIATNPSKVHGLDC